MKRYIYIIICVLLLPIGCKDDEEIAPAYREDLLDVQTDGSGRTIALLRDDGQRFSITSGFKTGLPADTVLRVMAAYEASGASAVVTAMQQVLVPRIQTYAAEKIVCAPVAVTACWQGGNYVNFKLSYLTGGGTHAFGFHREELRENADGTHTLVVQMLHARGGDPEYYTAEAYLCCPLLPTPEEPFENCDSVRIKIPTNTGTVQRVFAL